MSLLQNSNAISAGGAYNITDSLRFRSSAGAYLNWTPASAGNRRTWTWSAWVKRGSLSGYQNLFFGSTGDYNSGDVVSFLRIDDDGALTYFDVTASVANNFYYNVSSKKLRDPSAWYHIMVSIDTTQATASDRFKLYVNNEQVTSFTGGTVDPSLNYQTGVNSSTGNHRIGYYRSTYPYYFDGYMTEVHFVDGQALTPSDFGETNADGVWSPKKYSGTYGTNGFYLPMKETTQATGFNTVLYTATGTDNLKVEGVGFSPDFVWIKSRDGARSHMLYDTVRGATNRLASESTTSELSVSDGLKSFDTDGFTLGTHANNNTSGEKNVAWCWDAGSSTVSNTDGTITSSVRANPATGFSIVSYTGDANASSTVGHGLGSAPEVVIVKRRDNAANWAVWHQNLSSYTHKLYLNTTDAEATGGNPIDAAPTSTVLELSSSGNSNASGGTYVAYCFSEVAGFSKFGSYTGTGATGHKITTGFRPAFIMLKNTTTSGYYWMMKDNTRDPNNPNNLELYANVSDAEYSASGYYIDFDSDGFTINATSLPLNASSNNYIYMAFADTRDFQWNFDASGNKNNWTPNNINSNASSETTYDLMSDTPSLADEDTGNFATLNPNDKYSMTVSEGNLRTIGTADYKGIRGTISLPLSGKFYWETYINRDSTVNVQDQAIGLCGDTINLNSSPQAATPTVIYYPSGFIYINNSAVQSGVTTATIGDIIGVAVNMDSDEITFYKNGSQIGSTQSISSITSYTLMPFWMGTTNRWSIWNFGQRPFKYTPPTGYKKLNTYNLTDSSITDGSDYFNTTLYTGNGTSQSITGLGFSPDFVWVKARNTAYSHTLTDSVRGYDKRLYTNLNNAEVTGTTALQSFDADGFSLGSFVGVNAVSEPYVAWNWRGSDSTAVSNTDGTITSTVSANTTSGFSVVTYTGTGAVATVGHGLGVAPKVMIHKNRSTTANWSVYHQDIGNNYKLFLNLTNAKAITSNYNSTSPTSSVLTLGSAPAGGECNGSGENYVAYCFAEVEGFSKFGSYTGNGSTDGAFTYLGFKPSFVMIKRTDAADAWVMFDSARGAYNLNTPHLQAHLSSAEANVSTYGMDFLSNGFKCRASDTSMNTSGGSYIFMAFAENPFKNSLGR